MFAVDDPAVDHACDLLDRAAADEASESNCMLQIALMLARIALEPCSELYKEEATHAMLNLIRAKPKSNVVRLFGTTTALDYSSDSRLATA